MRRRELLIESYESMNAFDSRTLILIEPLRILRLLHYSAWIARRWSDPSFPRMFPVFGTEKWWQEEIEALSRVRQAVRNDDSIVVELRWRDVSIALTGDVGREVEGEIAAGFAPAPLRVIKVPHHGSLTSSSVPFLERLRPQIAVVSVGRSNTFGHPAPAVLRRYDEIGAEVYRTDRHGAITVSTATVIQ